MVFVPFNFSFYSGKFQVALAGRILQNIACAYVCIRVETTGIECFHSVASMPHFLGISYSERPLNEENKSNERLDEVFDEAFN
jgi:hypothetical protein